MASYSLPNLLGGTSIVEEVHGERPQHTPLIDWHPGMHENAARQVDKPVTKRSPLPQGGVAEACKSWLVDQVSGTFTSTALRRSSMVAPEVFDSRGRKLCVGCETVLLCPIAELSMLSGFGQMSIHSAASGHSVSGTNGSHQC